MARETRSRWLAKARGAENGARRLRPRALVLMLASTSLLAVVAAHAFSSGAERSQRAPPPGGVTDVMDEQELARAAANLPLRFEPNRGQTDRRVRFLARGPGYTLFLTRRAAVLSLTAAKRQAPRSGTASAGGGRRTQPATATVRIRTVGASPNPRIRATERQRGHINYLTGDDPAKWRTGLPGYGRVSYHDVYPGIDLVYHGRQGELEYDFVVAPGRDPGQITLQTTGAKRVSVDRGDLVLETGAGELRQRRPFVYQQVGRQKRRVEGRYALQGKGRVGFSLGAYDRAKPLIIDPVLSYSSYLGGGSDDGKSVAHTAAAIAVADGCASNCPVYLTGSTDSEDFPTESPRQGNDAQEDAFVTKLNASGTELVYSTYLGGDDVDEGFDVAVDAAGNAYLTGRTSSGGTPPTSCAPVTDRECRDFPTTECDPCARQNGYGGGLYDVFVTKLDPSGSELVYSTFLGGVFEERGHSIALAPACVPAACEAFVTGWTQSPDFPTTSRAIAGSSLSDGFVTRVSGSGSALVYSTYLGGLADDVAEDIAVDASGSAYVTGSTASKDFPTAPGPPETPYQSTSGDEDDALSPKGDAFFSKLDFAGSTLRLAYSTYLGGTSTDHASGIAVDHLGKAYVTGWTDSTDFPKLNAYQSDKADEDAFVTKLDPAESGANALVYSTYLGGESNHEAGEGIAVDSAGSAYVTGFTVSADFPNAGLFSSDGIEQDHPGHQGLQDVFVAKLAFEGAALSLPYSTLLGGTGSDRGTRIAVDESGGAYVTGWTESSWTESTGFPTAPDPPAALYQREKKGGSDLFVAKLTPVADLSLAISAAPDPVDTGALLTYIVTAQNLGSEAVGATVTDALPADVEFVSAPGCSQAAAVVTCELGLMASGATVERRITVRPTAPNPALSNTASVQSGGLDTNSSNDSATVTVAVRQALGDAGPPGNPAPGGDRSGGGGSASPKAAQARRMRNLRSCLTRARRHTRRERRLARRRAPLARLAARRHIRRHARRLHRRCVIRHGRTPGRVRALNARARSNREIVLSFRAPGTDRNRPPAARAYLVKQSTSPIRGRRGFRRAQPLCNGSCRFNVTDVGTKITLTITDLRPDTTYYYAVAARDNVSRRLGPRSRTVQATTR